MVDWNRLPNIQGARISLRELKETDIPSIYEIFSNHEVMRYWSTVPIADVAEARQMLEDIRKQFQQRTYFKWGIALNSNDLVIGTCTLFNLHLDHHRAEVGYALGRDYWGQGYMGEALSALFDFCFSNLDLHRLEADVDPRNANSIKTLERLGFRQEGYLHERWQVGGEVQDALFFGLLRRDWRTAQASNQS